MNINVIVNSMNFLNFNFFGNCFQEESCKITDKNLLIKSGFVLTGVVILFFLQVSNLKLFKLLNVTEIFKGFMFLFQIILQNISNYN
jgi:hypothetical protein